MPEFAETEPTLPGITLFGAEYSVYTRIVQICLREKQLEYRLVDTDIFDEAVRRRHVSRHPFGKIPTMQDGNIEIIESAAIVRYLEAAYPDQPLFPINPSEIVSTEQTIASINSYGYPRLVWEVYVPWNTAMEAEQTEPDFTNISGDIEPCLTFLNDRLNGRDFFGGSCFGAADAFVYPVLAYFRCVPWGREQVERFPSLASWFERVGSRASVAGTKFAKETELGR